MSESQNMPRWVLHSPAASSDQAPSPSGVRVKPEGAEYAVSAWHREGFFLSDAEFGGWRFGLLQEHLHATGLQAFVRSPLCAEATLVSDPHAQGVERLSVPAELPAYVGAFRIQLPLPLASLEDVVAGFEAALPRIKQFFKEDGPSHA